MDEFWAHGMSTEIARIMSTTRQNIDRYISKGRIKERDLVKIRVLFDNDGSLELAMKMFPSILEKDIRKIYEEVMTEKEK